MDRILKVLTREYSNVNQGALLLGAFAFLSQLLGLFRDRFFAHYIGPSAELDIYYASFLIPDLVFISIASLASVTVILPFLLEKMRGDEVTPEAENLLNEIFNAFLILIVAFSVLVFFLLPYLSDLVAPGFSEEAQAKVITMSRIMLLSPILLGLSNIFGSIVQLFRKFFIYAISPIFYNLGIILGIIFIYPLLGVYGLAIGVVLGALMHFLIQLFSATKSNFVPVFSFRINIKEVKKVFLTSLPRTLGLAFNGLAFLVLVALASYLEEGSISIFRFSYNLQSVPLGIIGLSYSVAAFPGLSKAFLGANIDIFRNALSNAARQIIFWSLPVTFLFIVLRAQIVRVILGTGSFTWGDTKLVAASLAIFSISVMSQSLIALFARVYYAAGNTKKPVVVNLISSIFIVALALVFMKIYDSVLGVRLFLEQLLKVSDVSGTKILLLPLAYSLGTILNFIILWYSIKRDFMQKQHFISITFFKSLSASFFIGFVSYLALNSLAEILNTETFWGIFLQGLIAGILGIIAGVLILYFFKSKELLNLTKALRSKFWLAKVILPSFKDEF